MADNTKVYVGQDIAIAVILVIFYFISRGTLAKTASWGIQGFYMLEIGFGILLQILLAIFDNLNARHWVASLRTGAIVYLLGLLGIVLKLGLLDIVFIIIFCVLLGMQLIMIQDLAAKKQYSAYNYDPNDVWGANNNHQALINNHDGGVHSDNPFENSINPNQVTGQANDIAVQRAQFFMQQRILQDIERERVNQVVPNHND